MSINPLDLALVRYNPPKSPSQFVKSEWEKTEALVRSFSESIGFAVEGEDHLYIGYYSWKNVNMGRIQGTEKTRLLAAELLRIYPETFLPEKLRELSSINPSFFLHLKIKFLASAFHLVGEIKLDKENIDFEGFHENFTLPHGIAVLEKLFRLNPSKWNPITLSEKQKSWVLKGLKNTLLSEFASEEVLAETCKAINQFDCEPVIIPTGYNWHGAFIIFYKDICILCDEGAWLVDGFPGIVVCQRKDYLVAEKDLKMLCHRNRISKKELKETSFYKWVQTQGRLYFLLYSLNLGVSNVGNCTFTNMQALVFALLILSKVDPQKFYEREEWKKGELDVTPFYWAWVRYNLGGWVNDFLIDLEAMEKDQNLKELLTPLLKALSRSQETSSHLNPMGPIIQRAIEPMRGGIHALLSRPTEKRSVEEEARLKKESEKQRWKEIEKMIEEVDKIEEGKRRREECEEQCKKELKKIREEAEIEEERRLKEIEELEVEAERLKQRLNTPVSGSDSNSFPLEARRNKGVILENMPSPFSVVQAAQEKIISNMTTVIGRNIQGVKELGKPPPELKLQKDLEWFEWEGEWHFNTAIDYLSNSDHRSVSTLFPNGEEFFQKEKEKLEGKEKISEVQRGFEVNDKFKKEFQTLLFKRFEGEKRLKLYQKSIQELTQDELKKYVDKRFIEYVSLYDEFKAFKEIYGHEYPHEVAHLEWHLLRAKAQFGWLYFKILPTSSNRLFLYCRITFLATDSIPFSISQRLCKVLEEEKEREKVKGFEGEDLFVKDLMAPVGSHLKESRDMFFSYRDLVFDDKIYNEFKEHREIYRKNLLKSSIGEVETIKEAAYLGDLTAWEKIRSGEIKLNEGDFSLIKKACRQILLEEIEDLKLSWFGEKTFFIEKLLQDNWLSVNIDLLFQKLSDLVKAYKNLEKVEASPFDRREYKKWEDKLKQVEAARKKGNDVQE